MQITLYCKVDSQIKRPEMLAAKILLDNWLSVCAERCTPSRRMNVGIQAPSAGRLSGVILEIAPGKKWTNYAS